MTAPALPVPSDELDAAATAGPSLAAGGPHCPVQEAGAEVTPQAEGGAGHLTGQTAVIQSL